MPRLPVVCVIAIATGLSLRGETAPGVALQPLAAQVSRLVEALDYLGAPLADADKRAIDRATSESDPAAATRRLQDVLDKLLPARCRHQPGEPRAGRRRARAARVGRTGLAHVPREDP